MQKQFACVLLIVLLLCGNALAGKFKDDEIIVKFKEGFTELDSHAHKLSKSAVKKQIIYNTKLIKLPHGTSVEEAVKMYNDDPAVEYAEPNYRIKKATEFPGGPDDTWYGDQWWHSKIQTQTVWGTYSSTRANNTIVVAVLDTGIDYDHPELASNIWTNAAETNCSDSIDNDGNGKIDDCKGWNFAYPYAGSPAQNDPMDDDIDGGHGTHIAGIIGAVGNNAVGVAGINWHIKLMNLKILDDTGEGVNGDLISAIDYAIAKGAKIINCSFIMVDNNNNYTYSYAVRDAILRAQAADVLFVASAGNEARDSDVTPAYPASYPYDNVMSVAATNFDDSLGAFSNYGTGSVLLAAPGGYQVSTIGGIYSTRINGYGIARGTSFAAPMVSGTAALLWGQDTLLMMKRVREILINSVNDCGLDVLTKGRLNATSAFFWKQNIATMKPAAPWLYGVLYAPVNATVSLKWVDNSTVETGYKVDWCRRIDFSNYSTIDFPADTTAYSYTVSSTDTNFYYRAYAFNGNGNSLYSQVLGPTVVSESGASSGCFIATAVYGSPDHPYVQAFRSFRDRRLMTWAPGRAFVKLYYRYSPSIAEHIRHNSGVRYAMLMILTVLAVILMHPYLTVLLAIVATAMISTRKQIMRR